MNESNSIIKIKDRQIGENHPPYIIAELSANHNGSLERALKTIKMAKSMGADAVKFQTYTPDTLTIDSDKEEQRNYLQNSFPMVDGIIVNEGEISFSNIIKKVLENRKTVFRDPIDGLSYLEGDNLIQGRPNPLTMDLSTMKSPFLSGLLDEFMNSDYQPLIQTS